MSEQKQLGIACGTPVVMLLMAIGASKVIAISEPPVAESVSAAHESFQAEVELPKSAIVQADAVQEPEPEVMSVTSLKPVEPAAVSETVADIAPVIKEQPTQEIVESPAEPAQADPPQVAEKSAVDAIVPPPVEPLLIEPEAELLVDSGDPEPVVADLTPAADSEPDDLASFLDAPSTTDVVAEEASEPIAIDPSPADPPADSLDTMVSETLPSEPAVSVVAVDPLPAAPPADEPTDLPDVAEVTALDAGEEIKASSAGKIVAVVAQTPVGGIEVDSSKKVVVASSTTPASPGAKPFLGVGIRNPSDSVITTVYAGSTAGKLGVKLGDQLVAVNGKSVTDMVTLRSALTGLKVADDLTLEVVRSGGRISLGPLPLGSR